MLKNYIIKLPIEIKIIYNNFDNFIILLGPNGIIKTIRLKLKLFTVNNLKKRNFLFVTKIPISGESIKNSKEIKICRGNETSLIKKYIYELMYFNPLKLNISGIGYRFALSKSNKKKILELKLGYSHNILINIPHSLKIHCPKPNTLFLIGNESAKISNEIRNLRFPEPYKGKGILFEYEKIKIKEGKKN